MTSGRLEIRRRRKIWQHCTKLGEQICFKMVPKKSVGLGLHSPRNLGKRTKEIGWLGLHSLRKLGKQICLKMVPNKLVGLGLHSLPSVLTRREQTRSLDLTSSGTSPIELTPTPSDLDLFYASSEMPPSDNLDIPAQDTLTDARYPDKFSDCGGSSGSWVGKRSEHIRRLKRLEIAIETIYQHIELTEQELYRKSNSRQSELQEIKEKIHAVQSFFS